MPKWFILLASVLMLIFSFFAVGLAGFFLFALSMITFGVFLGFVIRKV